MRKIVRRTLAGIASTLLAAGLISVGSASASAFTVSDPCQSSLVLIAVRGTDALPGNTPVWNTFVNGTGGVNRVGGYGSELLELRNDIVANLHDFPVFAGSLNYPATANAGVGYITSMQAGRDYLVSFLNKLTTTCPVIPMVVLIGHSQGADVIANALSSSALNSLAKGQVKAAVMFGDPYFSGNKNYVAPGSPTNVGGVLGARGSILEAALESQYQTFGWSNDIGDFTMLNRIRSYCIAGDWACAGAVRSTASEAIHNSYKTVKRAAAFQWVIDRITDYN